MASFGLIPPLAKAAHSNLHYRSIATEAPVPELPEVETVRLGLIETTCGLTMTDVTVLLDRTVAFPQDQETFRVGLQSVRILRWERRGKYLLAALGQDVAHGTTQAAGWLGIHLRMTGQLLWLSADTPLHKHTRVRFFFEKGQELRFVDQRTFGRVWWIPPTEQPATHVPGLAQLGPEPLSAEFSSQYWADVCQRRHRPIKTALLDQTLLAGLGNIYADESLFLSGIHPSCPCTALTPQQIKQLHGAIRQVLRTALTQGGTTFSDFRQVSGINGNYGGFAWVYRRRGQPCRRCSTLIETIRLAGRSCHFCPQCQPNISGST
jgi:formamidopyrimidine-DNA glycosylase